MECERQLTDEDFRKIKKLKKRALEEKMLASRQKDHGPSIHMPSFDFLEEREKLKKMTQDMMQGMDEEGDSEGGLEEADDEGEIIEGSEFEGEEEMDEGDEEAMDEEGLEEGDMMFEEGDEEGDEEMDGLEEEEDEDEEGESEVVVKGKKIEQVSKKRNKRGAKEEEEANSSFYDSDSEDDESIADPRTSFLSTNAIFDPERVKKRKSYQEIKQGKKDNREEHLQKKMGHKIKARGRLTNQQKRKNNPFQMSIQKKRLESRLKDLKKASKKTQRKMQKGHKPRKLGKSFGRK